MTRLSCNIHRTQCIPLRSTLFPYTTLFRSTLFASAGDDGAAQLSCDGSSLVKAVSSPAVDSLVTAVRSEEHTSELQSRGHLVCRLLLAKKKNYTAAAHVDPLPSNLLPSAHR